MDSHLYPFKLLSDAKYAISNGAMIGCNLSKKHKLTLYKT